MINQCHIKETDMGRTQKHVQKPSKFDLEVKVILGLKMYATHHLIVIHPCAKYGKQMSNHKKGIVKNPIYFTLRSKVNVISGSRICTEMDERTDRQTRSRGGYMTITWPDLYTRIPTLEVLKFAIDAFTSLLIITIYSFFWLHHMATQYHKNPCPLGHEI